MTKLLLIFAIFIEIEVNAQLQNLVYNSGFEILESNLQLIDNSNCINPFEKPVLGSGYCPSFDIADGISYQDQLNYWNYIFAWTCPIRKGICSGGVGSADVLCTSISESRTGYMSISEGGNEYTTQLLREPLISGNTYYVEVYYT